MRRLLKLMFYPPNAACRLDDDGQQLDELEGWLDRQKDHDAGDWPEAGDFTGGKHDRHASADDFQA